VSESFPPGFFPDGHFPDGHFPDDSSGVASSPPRRRFYPRGRLIRFAAYRARFRLMSMNESGEYLFEDTPKDPSRQLDAELDLYDLCGAFWHPVRDYALNEFTLPRIANGFSYETTVAGRTGEREPRWPTVIGDTVTSGSATFTCRAAASNALFPASSPSAVSDPSGLTISSVSIESNTRVLATYEGGTLDTDYDAVFTVTINGRQVVFRQRVNVGKQ
jgi:hypothetical protein